MCKFKVGDRVSVCGYVKRQDINSAYFLRKQKASVSNVLAEDEIEIKIGEGVSLDKYIYLATAHPRQCRRLVKKKRRSKGMKKEPLWREVVGPNLWEFSEKWTEVLIDVSNYREMMDDFKTLNEQERFEWIVFQILMRERI